MQKHIIVTRFSAMGDVAMCVPVVKAALAQHPDLSITVVSNPFFAPLFSGIDRCDFFAVHTKGIHKGVRGMWRLFRAIRKRKIPFAVVDLHDVLRTKLLRSFFTISGVRTAHIDKGRKEKKQLTTRTHKILRPLKTTHQRYADVFAALGLPVKLSASLYYKDMRKSSSFPFLQPDRIHIGVAPFAKHTEKMYPILQMKNFLQLLHANAAVQFIFFGAPGAEATLLTTWQQEFTDAVCVAGNFKFEEELEIIAALDFMVSMDSGNMHLASMFGIPVLSIWGATHPYAGFNGYAQSENNIVQASLYCRPCSVFGNVPCYRGDHACMHMISPEMLLQSAKALIDQLQENT